MSFIEGIGLVNKKKGGKHTTENYDRYRQKQPDLYKKNSFKTVPFSHVDYSGEKFSEWHKRESGAKAIVGKEKATGKWSTQSILIPRESLKSQSNKIDNQKIVDIVRINESGTNLQTIKLENKVKIDIIKYGDTYSAVPPKYAGPMEKIHAKTYPEAINKYIKEHNLKK